MFYGFLSVWLLFLAFAVYVGGSSFGFGLFLVSLIGFLLWRTVGRKRKSFDQGISEAIKKGRASRASSPRKVYHGYDHTCSPDYSSLLTACLGDRAAVDRLIAYEMKRDGRLSPFSATSAALDRLKMDRRHRY